MGKATGFLEYERKESESIKSKVRIKNFNEFHIPLSLEKQQIQGARCMECGVPFCQSGQMIGGMTSGCPLNNLIPEWNDLVYQGNWEAAYSRLAKTCCFPEFTSRVCPALCEAACTCNLDTDPVSTKENERAIIEQAFASGLVKPVLSKVKTGKRVAVVGSGPAGLATAMQLSRRGHEVTVLERSDRIGGLLRYGIPNMKLEKHIIDRRLALMEKEGVTFVTNANVGENIKAAKLLKDYDRIVLTCGASNPRDIQVPGRDASGIHFAVDYLSSVTKSLLDSEFKEYPTTGVKGKKVMVIGGGDTGNDCVGTAIRLGAASVLQVEMMPKAPDVRAESNPWPQWPLVCKTDYGQEEAIAVFGHDPRVYQTTVSEFIKNEKGGVCRAKLVKLESKKDEKSGRMMMVPIEGSEEVVDVDLVLIAAGFLGAQKYITEAFKVAVDGRTNVETQPGSYRTSVPNVFAAGDMRRGQSLVVWAIREGIEVAKEVDASLMGYTNL